MAVVEYACKACGLRVERFFRKDPPQEVICDSCGNKAGKCLSDFGFVFESGKVPGNTGVDSLDSEIDKVIGRDAESRWERIKDRNRQKRAVQREYGKVPIQVNEYGEYEPMSKKSLDRFQRLHRLNQEAMRKTEKPPQ